MTAVIRKASPHDLDALGRLGAMLIQTHFDFDAQRFLAPMEGSQQGYAAFLGSVMRSDEDCIFVADDGGDIAGYVFAALEPMSWKELRGPAGFIHDVGVVESARRSGIGEKLLRAAIDWLREHGAPRVILWTAARNTTAHDLFLKLGFRDTMTEMTLEV